MRDKRYRETALAVDVVDWLAWLELGAAADRTLDQYEHDLAKLCLLFPDKDLGDLTDSDLMHCIRQLVAQTAARPCGSDPVVLQVGHA